MPGQKSLVEISPAIDRRAMQLRYAQNARVQIRDVLTADAAEALCSVLERETPWGLAWGIAGQQPKAYRAEELRSMTPEARLAVAGQVTDAARRGEFSFAYGQYPMLDAYLQKWNPGGPLDIVLEHLNDAAMIDLVREVTGITDVFKADAQATLFGPGNFLTRHDDRDAVGGRRVAYVLNLTRDWRPDWGGYLLFYDPEGDVVAGFKPRFNTLNLFTVPQQHSVSYVPPHAPAARLAITGWFRNR